MISIILLLLLAIGLVGSPGYRVTGQMIPGRVGSWVNCCDPLPAVVCIELNFTLISTPTKFILCLTL